MHQEGSSLLPVDRRHFRFGEIIPSAVFTGSEQLSMAVPDLHLARRGFEASHHIRDPNAERAEARFSGLVSAWAERDHLACLGHVQGTSELSEVHSCFCSRPSRGPLPSCSSHAVARSSSSSRWVIGRSCQMRATKQPNILTLLLLEHQAGPRSWSRSQGPI